MSRTLFQVAIFVVLFAAGAMAGRAQQVATPPDVLSALLVEVRGLRTAMEQVASAGPRVQLALGRLQLQEQRITSQLRRLDSVKDALIVAQRELEPLAQRVKDETDSVNHGHPDADTQRAREANLRQAKLEWSRKNAEVQRLSAEETGLLSEIGSDQVRWTEFNQRLEELERVLGRR
jgi:hypothetical protein